METGTVIIQEPVSTKISAEEALAEVVAIQSSVEIEKTKLSISVDEDMTSSGGSNSTPRDADVVNGSGNKEIESLECEKGEATKNIDSDIVKGMDSETTKDEQGSVFVHESESFNINTERTDMKSKKETEYDNITQKQEELSVEKPVIQEDQAETKYSPEQEKEIGNISTVLIDTAPIKLDKDVTEKNLNLVREDILIKTDEAKDSTTVNGTEADHNVTVSAEETVTSGESLHDVEAEKEEKDEEIKTEAEPKEKEETKTVKTVVENPEITNIEETTSQEEGITRKTEEVHEFGTVFETPTIQGEEIGSNASKDTEEHEHVLVRDIPQSETFETEAEVVGTSIVQESEILKNLEPEETETLNTVISSHEQVRPSDQVDVQAEESGEPTKPCSLVIQDESHGREESVEETVQDESSEEKQENLLHVSTGESEKYQENELETAIVNENHCEEIPLDLTLKIDKEELKEIIKVDQVPETQTMEERRGLDVESVEKTEKSSFQPPSEESKETIKTIDENIEGKKQTLHPKGQDEGSYGLETKEEGASISESIDSEIIKEKASETAKDEQGSFFVHEPESFNTNTKNAEMSDMESKQEEFTNEAQAETKYSPEQEKEISNISTVLIDTAPEKLDKDGKNTVNETAPEVETATSGESLHDVFLEAEKKEEGEEIKTETDPKGKEETKTVKTFVEDPEIISNVETTSHEPESLERDDHHKENVEPLEATKNSDDAEQISNEVTVERKKQKVITPETEEVHETPRVIETPRIQGEDIEPKVLKDTEEHEHVPVTEAEAVGTSIVQGSAILNALEPEETETLNTVISSHEVRPSDQVDVQAEEFGEHTEPCSLEIKEESHGREESVEVESKETVQDESSEEKHENLLHVSPGESEKYQDNEPEIAIVNKNQFEEIPSDLTLKIDKEEQKEDDETKVDHAHGTQTMEEHRGQDVDSVEKTQKPSLGSSFQESEETSKTIDENIEEKQEEVTLQQKVQEEGSYGLETTSESSELGEKAWEEESRLPNEQEKETNFEKEQIEKHVPTTNEEVPSDQQSLVKEESNGVREVPSASPSEELEVETIIEDIKAKEEDKVQTILETVETHSSLPSSSSHEQEHGTVAEVEKTEDMKVKDAEPMGDASERSLEISETKSFDLVSEFEVKPELVGEILEEERREIEETRAERVPFTETETVKTVVEEKDSLVHDEETTAHESETLKDIAQKTEEVQESATVNEEDNESKVSLEDKEEIDQSSKDTEEHEHMLVKDMPQVETIVTGDADTSIVQESAMFNTLETKEDRETSMDLKEDKEQDVKTIISSNEVKSSYVQAELGEIDDVKISETVQEESNEKHEVLLDVPFVDLEKYQDNGHKTVFVEGDGTKHDQTLLDIKSVDEMQNLTLQTPSDVSRETSTTLDEKIEIKPEEEVTPHQEGQEEGSYGLETKQEIVSIHESSEFEEKSVSDPTPAQGESCLPNEQEKETKLEKEQTEKHEEVHNDHHSLVEEKSDDVPQVSSASPSDELEGEAIIHDIKGNEEEQVADKIQRSLELVETTEPHSSLPTSSEEKEHGTAVEAENIEDEKEEAEPAGYMSQKSLEIAETTDQSLSLKTSKSDETEFEEQKPKQAREILVEDITKKPEEVQEILTVIETQTIQEEDSKSKPSLDHEEEIYKVLKDTEEHEHALMRDMAPADTFVTKAETVDTSTVQESTILRTLEISIEETEAMHSAKNGDEEGPETKENTETSLDVKEDKEQEEAETLKTFISVDEVRSPDVQVEEFGEHTKSCSLEIKDESGGREESVEVKSNETVQEESNEEKDEKNLLDVPSGESANHQYNEPETVLVAKIESLVAVEGDETTHEKALLDDEKSENVCTKEEDIEKLESLKLEDSKEDKSEEVSETIKGIEGISDQTPKKVEEFHEAETMEAQKLQVADLILPVETSQPNETSSLVSNLDEDIHEEETKEAQKLHVEEILPTEIIPRESSDEGLVAMLASREEGGVRETKDKEDERPVSEAIEEIVGQTKTKEPEDTIRDKHVETPTLPIISVKNDNKILIAEEKKGHEDINETNKRVALGSEDTSKTSQDVCIKLEEFENPEAPKLEESKEDKSQETFETVEAIEATGDHPVETSQVDQTMPLEAPKLKELKEDKSQETFETVEAIEAMGDHPVETSQADQTTPLEAPNLDESKEDKSQETFETVEVIEATGDHPVETSQADQTTPLEAPNLDESKEDKSQEIFETVEAIEATGDHPLKTSQADQTMPLEAPKLEESKEDKSQETFETIEAIEATGDHPVETSKTDQTTPLEAPKLEESKEDKSQEIFGTVEAIEATGDHPVETSKTEQTLSSELVSGLDDQTPRQVEEIHEEETKEEHKFEGTGGQSLPVETSKSYQTPSSDFASRLDNQIPEKVEEIHEEEKTEAHKLQVVGDKISLVEMPQESQTPSLVSEQDDQTLERVEKIHEEQTKETKKLQEEETFLTGTVPKESFSEAPTSILASAEDEPVTLDKHNAPKNACLEHEELKNLQTLQHSAITEVQSPMRNGNRDYHAGVAEHDDESSSTLPVVEILRGLQTTLETDKEIEPVHEEQTEGDSEVYSNEKDCASDIIEANRLQHVESGNIEKNQEENDLSKKFLPNEELNLQEEVNAEEKLQEETREISECKEEIREVLPVEKILIASSHLASEKLEPVISAEKQEEHESREDVNTAIPEKISLQEEHPRDYETSEKEEKGETHETVKEQQHIIDTKEEKKSEEVQDELLNLSTSEVKKDKEDASELVSVQDFVSQDVEKEKETRDVLGSEEEINEVVISENKLNEEHVEPQAVSGDTKSNADKALTKEALEKFQVQSSAVLEDFQENNNSEPVEDLSVKKPSEIIQSNQSPNLPLEKEVEETSFEGKKVQEDKNEETTNAFIKNDEQVQDHPKDFETYVKDKETTEQEKKPNDLAYDQEDVGTNGKGEVGDGHDDSVVALKEEAGLVEEKREVDEYAKTELALTSTDKALEVKEGKEEPKSIESTDVIHEDLNKVLEQSQDPIAISEGNKTKENEEEKNVSKEIDQSFICEATKEIYQEESKKTDTITAVKEDIREQEETNVKNTDDVTEKTQPELPVIESLSSVSNTKENLKQKDEVPNQEKREIAQEDLNISEELQRKDEESDNTKDLFSEVKEPEPTVKEPARKSLSDLIHKVKETNKTEDTTAKPHIEEEVKTEEEDENGDEHKDDKTSPDSIVMVEAKDTVHVIKTHHKKSQGILSGVGSKVKHSISKVKKVLTGKSSHTTKPSSPK